MTNNDIKTRDIGPGSIVTVRDDVDGARRNQPYRLVAVESRGCFGNRALLEPLSSLDYFLYDVPASIVVSL